MRKITCLFFSFFCFLIAYGQSRYTIGVLPQVNVAIKIPKKFILNQKLELRQNFSQGTFPNPISWNSNFALIQSETVLSKSLDVNKFIGLGYLFRYEDQGFTHRFIQQFLTSKKYERFTLISRYRMEETISNRNSVEWRLRYRIGAEISLQGHTLEAKEFYLRANTELIPSIRSNKSNYEQRLFFAICKLVDKSNRVELGADYRASGLLNPYQQHQFWLNLNWAIAL